MIIFFFLLSTGDGGVGVPTLGVIGDCRRSHRDWEGRAMCLLWPLQCTSSSRTFRQRLRLMKSRSPSRERKKQGAGRPLNKKAQNGRMVRKENPRDSHI
ncbi:hypothetical protein BS47DRAFT_105379 [Hydnum rufescens UP504]|uniref:Secreted protein n=1 Tax=Hydnum rufescens UP504 TaxID=1448309 RepID=A0A9P6DPI0_9AGAM|nr:hypothetical protein BS47DRAFT_105379 [Hydnum rufescens UP504]